VVKLRYISLILIVAFAIGGCNPGIVLQPQPTVTDPSLYFFRPNLPVTFEDSILYPNRSGSTLSVNFVQSNSANDFLIRQNSIDSLNCTIGKDAVSISGLTTHSLIPLPSGYSIQTKKDSTVISTPLPIHHLIASSYIIVASNDTAGVYYSRDGGQNWTHVNSYFGTTNAITTFALLGDQIFAGTNSGKLYYTSISDGAKWDSSANYHTPIFALAANESTLYVSAGDQVYRNNTPLSSSSGGILVSSSVQINFVSLAAIGKDSSEVIVGCSDNGSLYYHLPFHNGADTSWIQATQIPMRAIMVITTSAQRFYCSTSSNGIYSSANGLIWTQRDPSLQYALLANSRNTVIATSFSSIDTITDDPSSPARAVSGKIPGSANDLSASASNYYVATNQGIYISSDAGASWNLSSNGPSTSQPKYIESPGNVILLRSISSNPTDSSWTACTMMQYQSQYPITITGRILGHLDSLSVGGKTYVDIIEARYSSETAGVVNPLIPYMQIFYAKSEGPVLIYQFANLKDMTLPSQKIYRK
jgi:hypothetical protein